MSVSLMHEETYFPPVPRELVDQIDELLERGGDEPARYFLASTTGEQIEIPEEVHRILRQVAATLAQGLAVTVAPVSQTLTTQQAADLLGVSRPTLIKLLDDGAIPYERVATHRRILLRDLLDYRQRRRAEQYAALEAMAVDIHEPVDVEQALRDVREARKLVAQRRRGRTA